MPIEAKCDRCREEVRYREGFLFYTKPLGNLLLCELCTDKILGFGSILNSRSVNTGRTTPPTERVISGTQWIREMNTDGIIYACEQRNFTPAQAKRAAHELAALWWDDEPQGSVASSRYWQSGIVSMKTAREDARAATSNTGRNIACAIAAIAGPSIGLYLAWGHGFLICSLGLIAGLVVGAALSIFIAIKF